MRDHFVAELTAMADRDDRIVLMTADLGFGVVDEFKARHPCRFINVGVAEQNMALVATGMALEGYVVFTYSIANFPTLRCLEMIRNDAAYHKANVKVIAVGGGLSYGALGMSHHATEDLGVMRAIPGITILSPTSLSEVAPLTRAALATPGTVYMRLDKDAVPDDLSGSTTVVGVPREMTTGTDVALFVTGGIATEVLKAERQLREVGISCSVFSVHTVRPLDVDFVAGVVRRHRVVVTVEEHNVTGGLGSAVLDVCADAHCYPTRFERIGLRGFSTAVGSQQYLRERYGLDAAAIASRVRVAVGQLARC
jgi:transketolase